MKILIAKSAGFCMGVRRAVEIALNAANKSQGPISTYGPLIHNPQAIRLLEEKGITVVDAVPPSGAGIILIRAHGIPPGEKAGLEKAGFTVVDATCPRVVKVQAIIRRYASRGFSVIIVGDRDHPEVIGLLGHAHGRGVAVERLEDLERLPVFEKAIMVAQTTQNTRLFEQIGSRTAEKFPHYQIFNTICGSTEKRQAEVARLSRSVDAVIVVGGRNSGNTRRLVEIARESGKPAQHVETEADLDTARLESVRSVGITAGASTPNWIIKNVFTELETVLSKKRHPWRKSINAVLRALLLTNIYVSIGAGCLSYACIRLQGGGHFYPHVLIAMLYVLSMHILNNLTGRKADRYNDPRRALFYKKNQIILAFFAIVAGGAGLISAFTLGKIHFLILLVMSTLGLSYNLRLVPKSLSPRKCVRIKDLPGSKTILIALAWGVVTALLPSLSTTPYLQVDTALIFVWSTTMVFIRSAFFDVLDMQGDRIVGKETFPLLLGEKRAMRLLYVLLAFSAFILVAAAGLGVFPGLGYLLTICPVSIIAVLWAHERGFMFPGVRLEFLIESHFILAGVITYLSSP